MKKVNYLYAIALCLFAVSCQPESQLVIIEQKPVYTKPPKVVTKPPKVVETPYSVRPVEKF